MSETRDHSEVEHFSFESAVQRLESLVRKLEDGQLGLSDSLACYEEGVRLFKHCHTTLAEVERKILLLTGVDEEGEAITEPFDEDATTLEQKQQTRSRRRSRPARSQSGTKSSPTSRDGSRTDMDTHPGLF